MKTKRPLKFKLDAYRFYAQDGMKPVDAFAKAGEVNNVPLSGCMTNRGYASSYMSDDVKNYLRKRKDDDEVVSYFSNWGLDITF
jgi:hypothetical protein